MTPYIIIYAFEKKRKMGCIKKEKFNQRLSACKENYSIRNIQTNNIPSNMYISDHLVGSHRP